MSDIPAPPPLPLSWAHESLLRNARLGSGLVLMAFVVLHLGNHALNLISLETAESARRLFVMIWRSPLGTILLYGSALIHVTLTLYALYRRRTLAMPLREWAQLVLGLAIPLLIAEHVVGTRIMHSMFGVQDSYEYVVRSLWVAAPAGGVKQAVALVVIWAHGCLGLYFWLRYRNWYARAAPWLLILAVLLPVLALLGFAHAGQTVAAMQPSPMRLEASVAAQLAATKEEIDRAIYLAFAIVVATVLGARLLRDQIERRNLVEIRYGDGVTVRVPRGYSVLDASRLGGIHHYSVCGGRGRCSTCRVRVVEGLSEQPKPTPVEAATLGRIHAESDVRLACQLRPVGSLTVAPLLRPQPQQEMPAETAVAEPGHEKVVAVMFCDMRHFTEFADQRLPFDVVFLLNRYFGIIGSAVEKAGGRLDKFIGDGAMVLFGLETPPGEACRQAITAATNIIEGVNRLSDDLAAELRTSIKVAIGIHVGQTIVGTIGYGATMGVTAIGDAVNIGSRLEAAAKELDADIVISEAAAKLSGFDFSRFQSREIEIRGRARPLRVLVVPRGVRVPLGAAKR
ncbi:adenylate/guanylate cyclase domain-containing protein [Mesorhizobium sp. BAC0120]|uniref:adenylate/guanylate cyclase domain-containing protein n=1 Tax=Mesorhizobium sp. BAC0120 TaxID=3090670 RepID=UPI00298CB96A|nr:adenylate/guanylate cyclase domain-containing protein [Mesorhizobium sp. BAC0120]MDW6021797.1 adenylate/guanylate cyclase domain-containing protein [Mesorhizobium sp. BAC0120]